MKNKLSNLWVRLAAYIIGTISAIVIIACVAAMVFIYAVGKEEEAFEAGYEKIAENYLASVLDKYFDDPEKVKDELENVNLYYTIIKDIPEKDGYFVFDDESTYVFSNVPDDMTAKYKYTFQGKEKDGYRYNTKSLLGALKNPYSYNGSSTWITATIEKVVLDTNENLFYFKTNVGYFLMKKVYVEEDGLYYDYALQNRNGERCYYNEYYERVLNVDNYAAWTGIGWGQRRWTIDPNQAEKRFEIITDSSIITEGSLYQDYYEDTFDDYKIYYDATMENPVYTVAAMIAPELEKDDLLKEWHDNVEWLYAMEEYLMIYESIAAILLISSLIVLMYTTEGEKEALKFGHKCPLFVYLAGVVLAEITVIGAFALIFMGLNEGVLNVSLNTLIFVFALLAAVMIVLCFRCISNLTTRIKSRTLFRYSELYYISRPLVKLKKQFWEVYQKIRENISLFWKVTIPMIIVDIVELMILCEIARGYYEFIILFILYKLVQSVVVVLVVFQMAELQKGSARIANGELSKPIDTSKMIWEFKRHGENINKVGEGISKAVESQLKSERLKTELITNVSHDIKTPLTSIINYVDLIKKEKYTDSTLCEYVDVLDRQSARLKKLIEDLMEASKASTGNLKVELEECDISMLIGQAAGEFEDRFADKGLETVITKPENPIYVMADGRHMWRVLDNLMNNIYKYSLSNSRVYIQLEQTQNKAVIQFKNISKTQLNISSEELMERFVRGDSSRNTEGSGLGLSIAQSLTELMGGTMELNIDGDLFKVILTFDILKKSPVTAFAEIIKEQI